MSDNVVLVAPRPLRVSSLTATQRQPLPTSIASPPADAFARIRLADDDESSKAPTPPSGRNSASPRLNLPSDALEEFLSILRPSLFTPSSPTFRSRRHGPGSALVYPYERPHPYKPRDKTHSKESSVSTTIGDDSTGAAAANEPSSPIDENRLCGDDDQRGSVWRISGILESPVSRTHTRNPFHRHPSYEMALSSLLTNHLSPTLLPLPASPSPAPISLSPSIISLPVEVDEMKA